jgi:hypothetical protein
MRENEDILIWEPRQAEGGGTARYCKDDDLVLILEQLVPGFDLHQMASECKAIPVGKCYLLTSRGYDMFLAAAEQLGKPELRKTLEEKKAYYWFRSKPEEFKL